MREGNSGSSLVSADEAFDESELRLVLRTLAALRDALTTTTRTNHEFTRLARY